jgi:predicted secreted Zn-dependent protease
MSMLRSFSISWKRDRFCVKLFCLAPSGKEHITTIYMTPSSMEHLGASMRKAVDAHKSKLPPAEDTRYIG